MPEMPYNQSCLVTAASEPPTDSAPSPSVLEVGVPVQQPAASNLGGVRDQDTSNCIADTNSPLDLWQRFVDMHRFGCYALLATQFIWSTGTWKSTEIVGMDQNPSTSRSTDRWY